MKTLETTISLGIGDSLVVRMCLDKIKHDYKSIKISYNKKILKEFRDNNFQYIKFLNEMGNLLFTEPPYQFVESQYTSINTYSILTSLGVTVTKPNIDHLLCQGSPLDIDEKYIVITTKARGLPKQNFLATSTKLWNTLNSLSKKYKIVIMGEREVEMSKEYRNLSNEIWCMYEQIIVSVPADRIVDLTVPSLGVTIPQMSKIKQDCLIMKNAEFVISLGIGGNLWLAASVANVIGYRNDNDQNTDLIANPSFSTMFLTKNFSEFINKLEGYV